MAFFNFNIRFYKQKYDNTTENPLGRILASLFPELLESSTFKNRTPRNTTYFWYIDDILIFLLQIIKVEEIAEKFNKVEFSINFTYEKESNNTIALQDILIIKSQNVLTFKVYRKPTNKKRLHTFLLPPQQQNRNRPHNWLLSNDA